MKKTAILPAMRVRCISLWQPWASLMACGAKILETRSWGTSVRGEVYIHAAQTLKGIRSLKGAPQVPAMEAALGIPYDQWEKQLPFGAVIATGELADTQPAEQAALAHPDQVPFGDFGAGRWVHCYEKLKRCLPIVPMNGKQGFFKAEMKSE